MVTADADTRIQPISGLPGHLALGAVAVAVFLALHLATGRIDVAGGVGWDGVDYASMLRDGWSGGNVHTRLRPLVPWLNGPLYALLEDPVRTFDAMNVVYAGLLAIALSLLMQRYGAPARVRLVAIVCIVLTNHFRLFAFYPVLVDLGACLMMTLALLLILDGSRRAAAVACIAAVLAREYAVIVLCFGVHRYLRRGVPVWSTAATFAPAAGVWMVVRWLAMRSAEADKQEFASMAWVVAFVQNAELWRDPLFVALFLHGVVTVAGGLSMLVLAQPQRAWHLIAREPEWVSYTALVLVMTSLGAPDLWRYLTPMLPVAAVFFASGTLDVRGRRWVALAVAVVVLTVVTQESFTRMDTVKYFTDWFPYYIGSAHYPLGSPQPSIWPAWGWRFLIVALAMCALTASVNRRPAEAGA